MIYDNVLSNLEDISAADAVQLLCNEFYQARSVVVFHNTGNRVEVQNLLLSYGLGSIAASDVAPIEFWGGPPQERKHYNGSLLTYLCDLILYNWVVKGYYADLVERLQDAS
jgi:hypothetical protein